MSGPSTNQLEAAAEPREQLADPALRASLVAAIGDAHATTRRLCDQLDDEQLLGPKLEVVNPPLWELGHVAWFYERWVIRHALAAPPVLDAADSLYDSMTIDHKIRWDLVLPDRQRAYGYADAVRERVVEALEAHPEDPRLGYHAFYALLHEDMHNEAFAYSRQTLGWPAPQLAAALLPSPPAATGGSGDAELAGGSFRLGAEPDAPFVFDNEKWAHEVMVAPFAIARTPVTEAQFAEFVDDGGYGDRRLWSVEGWQWRMREAAEHPVYWRRDAASWRCRVFDRWRAIERLLPLTHVSAYEAEAYCRWSGRRLPTEAEWELAASAEAAARSDMARRSYPWGEAAPTAADANSDGVYGGVVPVTALPAGDSAGGVRQLIGNVWEWTASPFGPFPGFSPDPYADYSAPWFGDRRVLRGGSWASPGRMLRNTLRNFFPPGRRDIFAGFRTCAR